MESTVVMGLDRPCLQLHVNLVSALGLLFVVETTGEQ